MIGAIVLAAGFSRRMGRLKPLLPFGDKPMLARVVENLLTCDGIASVIVVTGHESAQIQEALGECGEVRFAHNNAYADGMLSSVQCGVRALPPGCAAFFLVLGDQPVVHPATLDNLLKVWRETDPPLVLPVWNGRRGHPVLFSRRCIPEILALNDGATLKHVVQLHSADLVEAQVEDEAVLHDVDTPEDYERALRAWNLARGRGTERLETHCSCQ